MSDTPRTTLSSRYGHYVRKESPEVPASLAAQMEREISDLRAELAAANARVAELEQYKSWAEPQIAKPIDQSLVDENNQLRERLAAIDAETGPEPVCAVPVIEGLPAREALHNAIMSLGDAGGLILHHKRRAEQLAKKVVELEKETETLRIQLAACGVIAMSNTRESANKARIFHPDYDCASIRDVCAAVDREMELRERLAAIDAEIAQSQSAASPSEETE